MDSMWLTADEIAAFIKVKKPTIRLWTRQGMPHLKAGRLVRFNREQVLTWLEAKQQPNT
jgi:excisionase family DNA binding protein